MSDAAPAEIEIEVESGGDAPPEVPGRDRDILGDNPPAELVKKLWELRKAIHDGFDDQKDRADAQLDYWDCYNCDLNDQQFYNGNAQIYVPIVRDAVNARATRFVNQLFPQSGRYVEGICSDGLTSPDLEAMLDHYIRAVRFKTNIAKPLCRNGDIEGQYNLYCDWNVIRRTLVSRETHGPIDPQTGMEVPGPEIEDIVEDDIAIGYPGFEVLHDADILVLPATADTIEEAFERGGSVTIVRRWSKAAIRQKMADGSIREDEGERLLDTMGKVAENDHNVEKRLTEHVGISERGRIAVVWETWHKFELDDKGKFDEDGERRLCRVFFGAEEATLGLKRNPNWNDRCPLLSVPVEKIAGVFKGEPLIAPIASLQYEANDAVNQGADASAYSALPIVAADPDEYDGPLILNLAAMWPIKPGSVSFMTFPDLTPRALTRVQFCTQAIFQALSVNPAMLPQQTGKPGAKRNQAEVAMEQSVDLLTTAEVVSVLEEGIFTPAMGWLVDLDYQYRDKPLLVKMFGEMGRDAVMQEVGPLQNRNGFSFVWRGGDQARQNALMMQQGTGFLNVLRSMRQDLMAEGIRLRIGPLIEASARNIFGPVLGSKTLVDMRHDLTRPADGENDMLLDGFAVPTHPLDDDQKHITEHRQAMLQMGDAHGTMRVHIQQHMQQMQQKAQAVMLQQQAAAMQRMGGGAPGQGQPGGAPRAGGPGAPQPGAAPSGPRLMKQPAGVIHPDQLMRAGAVGMPRKM